MNREKWVAKSHRTFRGRADSLAILAICPLDAAGAAPAPYVNLASQVGALPASAPERLSGRGLPLRRCWFYVVDADTAVGGRRTVALGLP